MPASISNAGQGSWFRHILPYVVRAGHSAAQLGPKRDFYDTSQSVRDLRAVVAALGLHRLDVYGDS